MTSPSLWLIAVSVTAALTAVSTLVKLSILNRLAFTNDEARIDRARQMHESLEHRFGKGAATDVLEKEVVRLIRDMVRKRTANRWTGFAFFASVLFFVEATFIGLAVRHVAGKNGFWEGLFKTPIDKVEAVWQLSLLGNAAVIFGVSLVVSGCGLEGCKGPGREE